MKTLFTLIYIAILLIYFRKIVIDCIEDLRLVKMFHPREIYNETLRLILFNLMIDIVVLILITWMIFSIIY